MKKIFIMTAFSFIMIFGIFKSVFAVAQEVGCCMTADIDPPYCVSNVKKVDCDDAWALGSCPAKCVDFGGKAAEPVLDNSNKSECTFNGQGEEKCQLENPIGATEVTDLVRQVITAALGLIGAFTLLMLVWGGFQWLTSAGNPEKVSAGTQTMVWALIGVMIVLASYVLLSTFLNFLTGKG